MCSQQQNSAIRNASGANNQSGPTFSSASSRLGLHRGFVPSRDDGCHWSLISAANEHLPHVTKRSKHTMVLYKNSLYVFGGDDGKRMLNDLIKYDIEADQWVSLSSRLLHGGNNPPPRYHHSAVVYKNSMFVFGGYAGLGTANPNQPGYDMQQNSTNLHNKNDLHEYRFNDFAWIEWQFEGVTPTPRSAHCSFVYNKKLWIFGGYGSNRSQHDQRRLQILNDMWNVSLENTGCAVKKWVCVEQKGIIPPPCCNFSVTLVGNRLFLFSGVSGKEMTNHIFTFNLDTFQWTRISPEHILHGSAAPPQKRYGHTMVEYHHRLYVFGGSVSSATDSLATDLICFDLDHKSWEKVKPLPNSQCITARLFHTAVVYNDKMYIFGGTVDTDRRSNELFAFKFPTFPKCTLTEDLLRLLTEERLLSLSDIFFTFPDGDRLPAHAVIVAARCAALRQPIIDARAEWASRSGVPEVFIAESNRNAFHLVLQYLYTDRIRPDFTSAASRHELLLQIVKVCKLAAVYSLVRLESLCLRFLEETICMENILTVLSEAYSMNLSTLREYCIKKVVREDNFTALIQKEDFANLGSKIIVDLIRRHKQVQSVAPASPQSSCFSNEHASVSSTSQSSNVAPMPAENLEEGTLALDLFKLLEICFGISESDNSSSGSSKKAVASKSGLNSLEEFADVQLSFGDDLVIRAHRAVLAARSQYFLIEIRMPEGDLKKKLVAVCKLAAVYSLVRLESLCLRFLEETICMENILTVLSEAYSMNLSTLREYCIKKVVREDNFTALIQKEDFANLGSKIIVDLIRRHKQVQSVAPASPQSSCFSNEHASVSSTSQSSNVAPMPAENLEEGTLALDLFKLLEICFGISESDNSSSGSSKKAVASKSGLNSLEEFADVQLSFGDDLVIRAHRAVLAARSQYFLSLFDFTKGSSRLQCFDEIGGASGAEGKETTTTANQKTIRVNLDDIVPTKQALHSFLRYIYCGQTCMPPEDSLFLLRTPSYYGFTNDRLAHVCQQNLETNITVDTVIRVFITVDSVPQFSDFKDRCLHFIVNHFPELGYCEDKHLLSKEQICEIWTAYSTALSLSSSSPSPVTAAGGQHIY